MRSKSNLFGKAFPALFMISFMKMQLFIFALYAFGVLNLGEPGFAIVVALQTAFSAVFAVYDNARLDAMRTSPRHSRQPVEQLRPGMYLSVAVASFALLWSLLLLAELYSELTFGDSRVPSSNFAAVALVAVLSFGTVAMLYCARSKRGQRRNQRPIDGQ